MCIYESSVKHCVHLKRHATLPVRVEVPDKSPDALQAAHPGQLSLPDTTRSLPSCNAPLIQRRGSTNSDVSTSSAGAAAQGNGQLLTVPKAMHSVCFSNR